MCGVKGETEIERKKVWRIYAVASEAMDKKWTNASVFLAALPWAVGIVGITLECTKRGSVGTRNAETSGNDAYDIGLSHPVNLLHRTSPTHVCKVHFSGCTPHYQKSIFSLIQTVPLFFRNSPRSSKAISVLAMTMSS